MSHAAINPMPTLDLTRANRETLRWLILQALYAAQPYGCNEQIVFQAIVPTMPALTALEMRQQLDYLAERELLEITGKGSQQFWFVKLNNHGVDIVEYTTECRGGIARPAKYW